MPKTLIDLLLQLSEAGCASRLWGAAARPHYGPAFDRLLAAGVLDECAPAEEWPPCAGCECGIDARPIEFISGRLVATCPSDMGKDDHLDPDYLRSFAIDERRLATECLGGDPSVVAEVMPGVWCRAESDGRHCSLVLRRMVAEHQALLPVLRAAARGGRMALYAPRLSAETGIRLGSASELTIFRTDEAVVLDPQGGLALRNSAAVRMQSTGAPRLRIAISDHTVYVDGVVRPVPGYRFALLKMLIDAWERQVPVDAEAIAAKFSLRRPAELISDLKGDLANQHREPAVVKSWIHTDRRPTAYRLTLAPGQVEVIR